MRNRIIKINLIIAILLALNFIFLGCYNQNSDNNSLKEDSSGIEYKEEVFSRMEQFVEYVNRKAIEGDFGERY